MADKEEGKADWEVVSLTASTYAAAPGPNTGETKSDEKSDLVDSNQSETSNALFMSGHFVFPPSQHENLPLEPDTTEIIDEQEEYVRESTKEKGERSFANIEKLTESDNWNTEEGNKLTMNDVDFRDNRTFQGEPTMGESSIDDEDKALAESIGSLDSSVGSNVPNLPKHTEEDTYDGSGLPYTAWWKKQAVSLYAHAKETNTFWSIFIAAAVMGLVIIGQQWQQERWQVLRHRWHSGVYDEKFGRMVGPISRFKDAIIGSNRRGFSIRSRDN